MTPLTHARRLDTNERGTFMGIAKDGRAMFVTNGRQVCVRRDKLIRYHKRQGEK